MKYTGTILSIGKREFISDKFSKRTFVLTDSAEKYPNTVEFEMQNDNTDFLDVYTEGMQVDIEFNLRGRQWVNKEGVTKTYNTLVAYKIQAVAAPVKTTNDFPFP